ncbi:MAG: acyltransferase family protein [Bacteroides xylanisolvens]
MTRLNQFDILKAIGIILVIIGHTLDYNMMRNIIYSFHMPLFFLVSGYFSKVKSPNPPIKKLSKKLLTPYLLSCIIIIILSSVILHIDSHKFDIHHLTNWLQSIIYGCGVTEGTLFQSIGRLWFLLALFWGTIILHLTIHYTRYIHPLFISLLCVIISLHLSQHKIRLPLSILQGMLGVGYMYIGYLLKQYHPSITFKNKFNLVLIAVIWIISFKSSYLSMVQCYAEPQLLALTGALCGTYIFYAISNSIALKDSRLCTTLTSLGKMTLLILCVHSIEDSIIPWKTYINEITLNHYLSNSIIIFVRIFIVLSISIILQKFKLVQKIFNT